MATDPSDQTEVVVRTLEHGTHEFSIPSSANISHIKNALSQITGIPDSEQRLLYRGRELTDSDATIQSLNLPSGVVLHMVSRPAPTSSPAPITGNLPTQAPPNDNNNNAPFFPMFPNATMLGPQGAVIGPFSFQTFTESSSTNGGGTTTAGVAPPPMNAAGPTPLPADIAQQINQAINQALAQSGMVMADANIAPIDNNTAPADASGGSRGGGGNTHNVFATMMGSAPGPESAVGTTTANYNNNNTRGGLFQLINAAPPGLDASGQYHLRSTVEALDRMLLRLENTNMEHDQMPAVRNSIAAQLRSAEDGAAWGQAVRTFMEGARPVLEAARLNRETLAAINTVFQRAGFSSFQLGIRSFPVQGAGLLDEYNDDDDEGGEDGVVAGPAEEQHGISGGGQREGDQEQFQEGLINDDDDEEEEEDIVDDNNSSSAYRSSQQQQQQQQEASTNWLNSVTDDDLILVAAVTLGELTRRFFDVLGVTQDPTGVNALALRTAERLRSLSSLQRGNRTEILRQVRLLAGHLYRLAATAGELGRDFMYLLSAMNDGNMFLFQMEPGYIDLQDGRAYPAISLWRTGGGFPGVIQAVGVTMSTTGRGGMAPMPMPMPMPTGGIPVPMPHGHHAGVVPPGAAQVFVQHHVMQTPAGGGGVAQQQQQQQQQQRQRSGDVTLGDLVDMSMTALSALRNLNVSDIARDVASSIQTSLQQQQQQSSAPGGTSTAHPSLNDLVQRVLPVVSQAVQDSLQRALQDVSQRTASQTTPGGSAPGDTTNDAAPNSTDPPAPAPVAAATAAATAAGGGGGGGSPSAPEQSQQPRLSSLRGPPAGLGLGGSSSLRPRSRATATTAQPRSTNTSTTTTTTSSSSPPGMNSDVMSGMLSMLTNTGNTSSSSSIATTRGGGGGGGGGGGLNITSLMSAAAPALDQLLSGMSSQPSGSVAAAGSRSNQRQESDMGAVLAMELSQEDAARWKSLIDADEITQTVGGVNVNGDGDGSGELSDAYIAAMPPKSAGGLLESLIGGVADE